VFDVHPPASSIHGWREFLLHLATITVGLLIALGLEASVEWFHHRHVMHQAQVSLLAEIKSNAESIEGRIASLQKHRDEFHHDLEVLDQIIAHGEAPNHEGLDVTLDITGFDDVSWVTAQATGAVTYMPYSTAREYSNIYGEQAEIERQVHEALRDFTLAVGPLVDLNSGDKLDPEGAKSMKQHIQTLQGQLYMVHSLMQTMEEAYKKFLAAHPKAY
jgi:hypothetical protein